MRKKFNDKDYQWGLDGERFVYCWLSKLGYKVEANKNKYGADLFLHAPKLGRIPIEVERRKPSSWPTKAFPWDDYNLPERRYAKSLKSLLIVLAADMSRALLVYPSSLFDALQFNKFCVEDNVYVKCEKVLRIPVDLCRDVCTNTRGLKIGRNEEF